MWGRSVLALALGSGPAEDDGAPTPEATEEPMATPATEADDTPRAAAPLRLIWEAGLVPIPPEEYLQALRARLPPGRFEEASSGADDARTWVVTIEQPQPGVYRLVVAPPDRQALARRVDLPDPAAARRTLALLTATSERPATVRRGRARSTAIGSRPRCTGFGSTAAIFS